MKIAMIQTNPIVGDMWGNTEKLARIYKQSVLEGADIAVGSEMQIWGYPAMDQLTLRDRVSTQLRMVYELERMVGDVGLITGVVDWSHSSYGRSLTNTSRLMWKGEMFKRQIKNLLPTYDVFDEARYFEPGKEGPCIFDYKGERCAMLTCEDIWGGTEDPLGHRLYINDPVSELVDKGIKILFVINASPYYWGKGNTRFDLVSSIAKRLRCTVVYVNQVGGNDSLVFDGRSFAVNSSGICIAAAKAFEEDFVVFDTESSSASYPFDEGNYGDAYQALVLGTRDYMAKCGFGQAVIGLSGGIDSALTAAIAVDAIGPENVFGVGLPSPYSSEGSIEDARSLANNLGIRFEVIRITPAYQACEEMLLGFGWSTPGSIVGDVSEENLQARIRGTLLMYLSNKNLGGKRTILLTTGNKSELAVGFCTLYGDMNGGLAVISDVPKTLVFELARYRNSGNREVIPLCTIEKPPSAELREGQVDSQSLPPYDILDKILRLYVEGGLSKEDIVFNTGIDREIVESVVWKVDRNEFKRQQAAPGLKITGKAFGNGRRMPIAAR